MGIPSIPPSVMMLVSIGFAIQPTSIAKCAVSHRLDAKRVDSTAREKPRQKHVPPRMQAGRSTSVSASSVIVRVNELCCVCIHVCVVFLSILGCFLGGEKYYPLKKLPRENSSCE